MSLIRLSSIVVLLLAGTAITVKEYIESLSVQPLPAQAVEHEHAGREICPRHQEQPSLPGDVPTLQLHAV